MKTLILIASFAAPTFANQSFTSISCDDLSKNIATATVIDVRYPNDYLRGHIKGAVSFPFYSLKTIS